MSFITVECNVCKVPFRAKVADRKRGWAKCCSKSCAATRRNRKTGKYRRHLATQVSDWDRYADTIHPFSSEAFEP